MTALEFTVRPLAEPVPITGVDPYFSASWSSTRELLAKEAEHLRTARIIVEMDVTERMLRLDGQLRADARPRSPGLAVVLLGTLEGDIRFQAHLGPPLSWYDASPASWQSNMRAVALTLEALRKVDRYGTTPSSEQYSGFRQIEAASAPSSSRGADLAEHFGSITRALLATHPDSRVEGYTHDDYLAVLAFKEGR